MVNELHNTVWQEAVREPVSAMEDGSKQGRMEREESGRLPKSFRLALFPQDHVTETLFATSATAVQSLQRRRGVE